VEKRDTYGALVGKLGGKRPLGRTNCRCKDNNKWILKREYEGVSKISRTGAAIYTAVVVARSAGRW
jgi:hypothetical protein